MTTSLERAEKIFLELQHFAKDTDKNKIMFIAAEIDAAVDEAWSGSEIKKIVREQAKAEAFEEAVKIAENIHDSENGRYYGRMVANAIRAKAAELK